MYRKTTLITVLIMLAILLVACSQQNLLPQQPEQSSQNPPEAESNLPEVQAPTGSGNGTRPEQSDITETSNQPQERQNPQQVGALINTTYTVVDTGQNNCYSDQTGISCPSEGEAFYGQDAQYQNTQPAYQDNGDGTVTDLNTGLMWQQDPGEKMTYAQAVAGAESFNLAGYDDWRLPTIKELYSLIRFSGTDVSNCVDLGACTAIPFIDTDYFHFEYGDTAAGERTIDSQWATSSIYTGAVFGGQQAMFGVNFADGRIKGYPTNAGPDGQDKLFYVIYVRGNPSYGTNVFVNNGDGTITDQATNLTWTQNDSGTGLDWEGALNYCAGLETAGIDDWRLPNAKELQSIVDYSRSPDVTNSAAIDPIFNISTITNEAEQLDYPAFWSSTTHLSSNGMAGIGVYVTFGRALGYMHNQWIDVHGAGAQRAEDKSGDTSRYLTGHGPQGDAVRIYNYARCVTGGTAGDVFTGGEAGQTGNFQPGIVRPGAESGQGGPPQEAIDACTGLAVEAACTVNTPTGSLSGSCGYVPSGEFACIPEGGPLNGNQSLPPDSGQRP